MRRIKDIEHFFPVTIIDDRFGGLYSGGAFLAFNLEPWDVPKVFSWGGDIECADFWGEESSHYLIGKGDTPAEAYNDLIRLKMINNLHCLKGVPQNGIGFSYYYSMNHKIQENEE